MIWLHLVLSRMEQSVMADTFWRRVIQMTAAVLESRHATLLKCASAPRRLAGAASSCCAIRSPGRTPTTAAHSATPGLVVPALGYLMVSRMGYCRKG